MMASMFFSWSERTGHIAFSKIKSSIDRSGMSDLQVGSLLQQGSINGHAISTLQGAFLSSLSRTSRDTTTNSLELL